jgi:CheY-like chemotaxis protein
MTMGKDQFRSALASQPGSTAIWEGNRQFGVDRWKKKYRVVVADDFAEQAIMLACAMRQTKALQLSHTFTNNAAVTQYLLGHGRYADREKFPFPEVLITELGPPCLEILTLLAAMDTEGFQLPLRIVLTDSPLPEHQREAERLGADAFFRKPERFQGLVTIVREIERMVMFVEERNALLKLCGVRNA